MRRLGKILSFIFLIANIGLIVYFNKDINKYIVDNYIYTRVSSNYTFNEYAKKEDYEFAQIVTDFTADSKQDLVNILYTIIDSGTDNFTFYCSENYHSCLNDVTDLSNDVNVLAALNNFVHPFNSYSKLYLSTNKSGKIEVEIEKLYTKEEINYINNEINEIEKKTINSATSIKDKIKAFHDYIINNTKYDSKRAELIKNNIFTDNTLASHKANGVLKNKLAICSGYTDIMTIYLNKLGINNYKISNISHIWNLLYIDSAWVHLDLTWDDPVTSNGDNILLHEFFLIDTDTLKSFNTIQHIYDADIYQEAK